MMTIMIAIKMPIQRSRQSPISSFPDPTKALYVTRQFMEVNPLKWIFD